MSVNAWYKIMMVLLNCCSAVCRWRRPQ